MGYQRESQECSYCHTKNEVLNVVETDSVHDGMKRGSGYAAWNGTWKRIQYDMQYFRT